MAESRTPTPGALALAHKLAPTETGHRYTCPSYEVVRNSDGASLSVPGFQPLAAYEVAVANLAPDASRREDPDDVREVLDWAGEPLATIEVATDLRHRPGRRARAPGPRRRRGPSRLRRPLAPQRRRRRPPQSHG